MNRASFNRLLETAQQGRWPYILTLAHFLLGALWVYFSPRSNIAFLVLFGSLGTLYALKTDNRFKLILGALFALVIMPIAGVRNIFYLEIIFQISVFVALALGLNIVAGFALACSTWVTWPSMQSGAYPGRSSARSNTMSRRLRPGTQPIDLPFLLPGDAFYLFLLLAIIVAALTGILLGLPVLRLRGDYLAIVTLGFGEVDSPAGKQPG